MESIEELVLRNVNEVTSRGLHSKGDLGGLDDLAIHPRAFSWNQWSAALWAYSVLEGTRLKRSVSGAYDAPQGLGIGHP